MFSFVGWLIIGLVAGAVARFVIPGKQPMGIFGTMMLGLFGSIIGGAISVAVFGYDPADPGIHAGGIIMSTLGAAILLGFFGGMASREAPG